MIGSKTNSTLRLNSLFSRVVVPASATTCSHSPKSKSTAYVVGPTIVNAIAPLPAEVTASAG